MSDEILADVFRIYQGSDGEATKALYARLEKLGPKGIVAVNLFRACKASERAKVYRRGYKSVAYEKKQWSMDNLCKALREHAVFLGMPWGWGLDPKQEFHRHVLYIELPTGQVSFHTAVQGDGPIYGKEWDGVRNAAPQRICTWVAQVLAKEAQPA